MPTINYAIFKSEDSEALMTYAKTTSSEDDNPFYLKIPLNYVKSNNSADSMLIYANPDGAQTLITSSQAISSYGLDPKNWILCLAKNEIEPSINSVYASSNRVLINWNAFPDWMQSITYNIYRSETENGQYTKINQESVDGLYFTDTSALNGQTYYYRIKAIAMGQYESGFSNTVSASPINFPMDQGILLVDETRDATGTTMNPTDQMVDDFYNQVIDSEYTNWDCITQGLPDINTIKNYSLIIWYDDDSLISTMNDNTISALSSYLIAGGKLMISGWKTVSRLPESFMNSFCNGIAAQQINTPIFVSAQSDIYSDLNVNSELIVPAWNGKLNYVYVFPNAGNVIYTANLSETSPYQDAPVMIKYNNLVLSGIPLYYMQTDGVHAFMSQLINNWTVSTDNNVITKPELLSVNLYPNPVNRGSELNISVKNSDSKNIKMSVYNVKGQLVYERKQVELGRSGNLSWNKRDMDGKSVSSGIYFIRINDSKQSISKKCLIIK
jgi:hypothetical protein